MKASKWTAGLAAAVALSASGVCIADVGIMDGKDSFTDFRSSKTRAEVQQELLDAKDQGLLPRGGADSWNRDSSSADIGARGPAGSRYQARTREEVMDELRVHRLTHNPSNPSDIYFGG
jgi:hypothetical protein